MRDNIEQVKLNLLVHGLFVTSILYAGVDS